MGKDVKQVLQVCESVYIIVKYYIEGKEGRDDESDDNDGNDDGNENE